MFTVSCLNLVVAYEFANQVAPEQLVHVLIKN